MSIRPLFVLCLCLLSSVYACKKGAPDGQYCAEVSFKHQGKDKLTKYKLLVDVKNQQLVSIRFPEGHYDTTGIPPTNITDKGTCTVVSTQGLIYQVEMKGPAEKCLNATNLVQCLGLAKNGARCKRMTDNAAGYCWQHQEQAAAK